MYNFLANKTAEQKKMYGLIAIILAASLATLDGVIYRPALTGVPILLIVLFEHLLGFIFLAPFIYLGWNRIKNLTTKDWSSLVVVSLFGGLIGNFVLTKSFFVAVDNNTTLAAVIVLQKLQPFFVIILARIFLKERLPQKFYIWATIAIMSAYFLSFGKEGVSFYDIANINIINQAAFFAVLAALAYAFSTVFSKRLLNHLDYKSTAALRYGATVLFTLPVVYFTGRFAMTSSISWEQWQNIFIIGVITGGALFFIIHYWGLRFIPVSLTTIGELFFPLSAVVLDYFVHGSIMNSVQIVAAIILVISFYFVTRAGNLRLPRFTALTKQGGHGGKFIGFNTVELDKKTIDIDHGVYAVYARINNKKYKGLVNFGFRETFHGGQHLELYLPDFVGNYYGLSVRIKMLKKIRDTKKFKNAEGLKERIKQDLEELDKIK